MSAKIDPFRIELLIPTKADLQGLKKIKVMDIMDGFTKNFHPDGMFSTEIFGKVGEQRRSRTFAYIDLNVKIFHPLVYKVLVDLKELYGEIMAGKSYAIFDEISKDFVKSNIAEGDTGYNFFVQHFPKLKFEKRPSISRKEYIEFIEKSRSNPFIEQLVIMAAGLRDYTIDEDGKPSEDEINSMYRSIMAVAATMENISVEKNPEFIDASRSNLQTRVLELYRYIVSLVVGKHKLIQGSFLSRRVSNTTRNVISAYIPKVKSFGDESSVTPNTTVMGLYQFLRDVVPLVVYNVRTKFSQLVFTGANTNMTVVDAKTLRKKSVPINSKAYNSWMTYEGIEKICDQFSEESMRHYPVMIGDSYYGLIYKGPDMTFKFFQDIEDLPKEFNRKHVTPITMIELLYMASYELALDAYGSTTRYPITEFGSTYPGTVTLKSTVKSEVRTLLSEDWSISTSKAISFPINGEATFNSMSPAPAHIGRMGADYDGDQSSHYIVMTEEAKKEIKDLLDSRDYYLNIDNTMAFSQNTDYISLALKYLTKR